MRIVEKIISKYNLIGIFIDEYEKILYEHLKFTNKQLKEKNTHLIDIKYKNCNIFSFHNNFPKSKSFKLIIRPIETNLDNHDFGVSFKFKFNNNRFNINDFRYEMDKIYVETKLKQRKFEELFNINKNNKKSTKHVEQIITKYFQFMYKYKLKLDMLGDYNNIGCYPISNIQRFLDEINKEIELKYETDRINKDPTENMC